MFVAVYQKALSLMYVDELLGAAKAEFVANHYKANVSGQTHACSLLCLPRQVELSYIACLQHLIVCKPERSCH